MLRRLTRYNEGRSTLLQFTDRGEFDLQLVACSGHGKNGALSVLQVSQLLQ